jgi:hypothetical protein
MAGIADFLKELAIEVGVEFFSVGTLKKFITKTMAQKVAGQNPVETKEKDPEEQDDIKSGGMLNLSDEEAYADLMAMLEISPKIGDKKLAFEISSGVNIDLPREDQKRRFRVVFGRLSRAEYVKEIEKTREKTPQAKGEPKIKESSKEIKVNLAIELLRSFVNYTSKERCEVYEAMGIMDSELQRGWKSTKKWLESNEASVLSTLDQISTTISGPKYEGLWAGTKKTLWPFGQKNKGGAS